jgi:hypothetical protein
LLVMLRFIAGGRSLQGLLCSRFSGSSLLPAGGALAEDPPHLPHGLAEPVFVFVEGHADEAFAGGAEAAAGADGNVIRPTR